jgi:UDP-glucose 4-epimerase
MVLRFFNPAGSHCSKLFSENPKCEASNLFPAIINSIKNQNEFHIFGGSYSTADGTPVRDFIHVCDLSEACVQSVRYVLTHTGYNVVNIGSGVPHTVLNIYSVFAQIANCTLSYVVMPPRYGDLPFSLADISFAYELLDWRPKRNLEQICIDSL